jgi:hypothetical protein
MLIRSVLGTTPVSLMLPWRVLCPPAGTGASDAAARMSAVANLFTLPPLILYLEHRSNIEQPIVRFFARFVNPHTKIFGVGVNPACFWQKKDASGTKIRPR